MEQIEESVNRLSLLFGICGFLLLCSLPLYVAYPIVWLPLGMALFPFGSGLIPIFPLISNLGLLPSNAPTSAPPLPLSAPFLPLLVFYATVELIISIGLYKKAEWIRITLCLVSIFIILSVIASWLLQISFSFVEIAHTVFGAFIIWYMTRSDVRECFKPTAERAQEYHRSISPY